MVLCKQRGTGKRKKLLNSHAQLRTLPQWSIEYLLSIGKQWGWNIKCPPTPPPIALITRLVYLLSDLDPPPALHLTAGTWLLPLCLCPIRGQPLRCAFLVLRPCRYSVSYRIVSYGARWAIAPGICTAAPILLPWLDRDGVSRSPERVGWVGSGGEVEVDW
jgi:hypothetical protein